MLGTALVTGACGFVGSHMVEYLLGQGYDVIASDHPRANRSGLSAKARFLPIDLTDRQSLVALNEHRLDKVFHIAGLFDYTASWERLYGINCEGTQRLLEILSRQQPNIKSIVVWSSGSVYGRSFRREPLKETEPPLPTNLYEKSKLLQEQASLKFYTAHGLPVVVVRPAAIYGPRSRYGLAVSIFMIRKGLLRFIPGKGDFVGGYAHVDDIVAAADFLSNKPEAIGEIFNISDNSAMPIGEAIQLAASAMGVSMLPIHVPLIPIKIAAFVDQTVSRWLGKRPTLERDLIGYLDQDSWMDNSKLKALGYSFKYPTLREGFPGVIAWYKEHRWI